MASELFKSFAAADLDIAIDRAARKCSAVVSEFAATISNLKSGKSAIEISIEFFVAPLSMAHFADEFEEELMEMRLGYAAARHRRELDLPIIHTIAPGTFHQWRIAWRKTLLWQRENRWMEGRELVDGVVRQSQMGWRETALA